jgi:hypothetical protein
VIYLYSYLKGRGVGARTVAAILHIA